MAPSGIRKELRTEAIFGKSFFRVFLRSSSELITFGGSFSADTMSSERLTYVEGGVVCEDTHGHTQDEYQCGQDMAQQM